MSYTDERDEIAEFFGAKPVRKKPGYSEELGHLPAAAEPVSPLRVKRPFKLVPPEDIEPHPLDLPPARQSPPAPVRPAPEQEVEDEELLVYDSASVPDLSNLEFTAPVRERPEVQPPARAASVERAVPSSARVERQSPPVENRATPVAPIRVEPSAEPARNKSEPVERDAPPASLPERPRTSPARSSASEHQFVSDETLRGSSPRSTLLETRGLIKIYDGRSVVNGVDINVKAGEIVGLLGPNGAGKTTSFYMIVGLVPPNGGEVLFNGNDVTAMPMYMRARLGMGYLPQEESIFRRLTVEENLMAVVETLDLPRKEALGRVQELLERFSITHIRKNLALTCSGGEKRRLTIARSLVTKPSLLMLDEPFSGVDPIAVNEIQNIVSDLRKSGLSILITDHNARQTLELVDRAYLIYEGRVLREGTRDFLINDPVSRELYLGERFTM